MIKINNNSLSQKELNKIKNKKHTIDLTETKTPEEIEKHKKYILNQEYKLNNNIRIRKTLNIYKFIAFLLIWSTLMWFMINNTKANLETSIKVWNYNQAITVYDKQVKEMISRWYSKTKILDLLAIKSMECNRYDWLCYWRNNNDVWPFQINKIHREQYNHSLYLMKKNKLWALFLYQLDYASKLYDSYNERFCWPHIFDTIFRVYTNERHYKCIAVSYNWHPKLKYFYAYAGWKKREVIKEYLIKEFDF